MAKYGTKLTAVGIAKLANAQVTSNKVQITHIAIGDGNGVAYTPTGNETALKRETWRGAVNKAELVTGNTIIVEGIVPASVGGFTMREVGLYDADGAMIAVGNYPETERAGTVDGIANELILRTLIKVNNASAVDLTINTDLIIATKAEMDVVTKQLAQQHAQVTQHLDEIGTKYLSDFDIVADGVTDDTVALQNAINYCSQHKLKLRNGIRSRVIKTTAPIYLDGWLDVDLTGAEILKTTNTVGVGSNKQRSNAYTTSYAVDAIFIIRHIDNQYSSNIKLRNIVFSSNTTIKNKYAIYAPFLVDCEFENLIFANCDYGLYGYCWYLIPTIKNLKADALKSVVALVDDGTQIGSSTSVNFNQIYGTNCENVLRLYGLSYGKLNIPCGDHCTSYMLHIESCKAIVVDAPSTEHARNGNFAYISNSDVVINAPNAYQQHTDTENESYMFYIDWYSRVVINGGTFEDFNGSNLSNMFKLISINGSHVIINNTKLPTNGNGYMGLTNGSTITKNNDETGRAYYQLNGDYLLIDKLNGTKITQSTSSPTSGTWALSDICYNTSPAAGAYGGWICVEAGSPGVWRGFNLIESW